MNIGCCEVAIMGLNLPYIRLAIYAGYNLKLKAKEAELEKRTTKLEKKNGKELAEIEQLKKEIQELKEKYEKPN